MRLLFCLFGLFTISLSASAASEWFFYKNFPWVYDNVTKDWLYLRGTNDGKFYAYRNSTKEWEEFTVPELTWEQKYEEWIQNPEPYGGLSVLQQIKEAKDSGATHLHLSGATQEMNISDLTPLAGLTNLESLWLWDTNITDITPQAGLTNLWWLDLTGNNISDITPLAGLTNLMKLGLLSNNISDITPLAGLTNLTNLILGDNPITASQKAMLTEALPNTTIYWPNVIIDDTLETEKSWDEKSWDEKYEEWIQNPEPYGGLEVLQQIKEAKESGVRELDLYDNYISDITPLAGLTNLTKLDLWANNISDISLLADLMNLTELWLGVNNISDIAPLAELTNLTELFLSANNISDLTSLAGLSNLTKLSLWDNNISDLTPLAGLTNLTELDLNSNPISASQKAMLEEALPNTNISWPSAIINDEEPTTIAKTAKLEIFTDSLDWEAIFKSRDDYVYTNYNVIDDGFSTGNFKVSISAYDANYPNIQATSTTIVDISNFRSDENGDGIYDILDPAISYQGSFTGTETANYYNNNSYLGNVVFETLFDATRSSGQTFVQATIFATVTSSSISAIQVGQTFSVNRDYYTLGWSGTLDYDTTSYQASFSDNQTKVGYSANSQITQTNESSITLKNFSLPNSLGTTTNTDISLTREGDIFHKQFVSNGITYYFRVLDIKDSIIDDSQETEKTWEEKYEEWIQNPEPYGGLRVLQWIKQAKESGYTWLSLSDNNISDLTPLAGLTNLTELDLWANNISDLTPLAGLANLTWLRLEENNISDLTPLTGLSNLTELFLGVNNITDVTPLAGLRNLTELDLWHNNITDISPLADPRLFSEFSTLFLNFNNIFSDSQKAMLEEALPSTFIFWD